MITLQKKHILWTFTVLFIILLIHDIYTGIIRSGALKDSIVITGSVESIVRTRGAVYIYVQYLYQGKVIHNSFETYDRDILDTLKQKTKIKLKVSKQYPTQHLQYIGIYTSTNNEHN